MARPVQKEQRKDARADLVADARQLILSNGYTATSVDAINRQAGLSKGTFYHYFKSKSELLDAVVDQLTQEGWQQVERAIASTEGGALARFHRFLAAARRWRIVALPETAEIMRAVQRPENALLRERVRDQSINLVVPALAGLLADGNREGVLQVPDTEAAARVFMILAYGVSDDMVCEVLAWEGGDDELLQRLVARGTAFMRAIEALLGVAPASLGGPDTTLLASMVAAFRSASQATGAAQR